jgi:hypothetical protein
MIFIPSLMFSLLASAAPTPPHLTVSPCRIGEHQQFEVVTCDIELKNNGDKPIKISKGEAALAWDSIQQDGVVPAHGATYLKATVALRDSTGFIKRSFRFATDEPGQPLRGASVHGFVASVLDQNLPAIDFGAVKLDGEMPTKSVELTSREAPGFRLLEVTSKPAFLDVSIDADGHTVRASVRKDAPWGLQHEKIKLKTNAPQQPEAWVSVDVNVIGDIAPGGNPFSFGLMRTNNKNEFLLRLTRESGKPFEAKNAKLEQVKGKVDIVPCIPASDACKMLRIVVGNDQPLGRLQGLVSVELPEFKRTLPIEVVGMLLSPDYKVHDFNEEMEKAGQAKSPASSAAIAPAEGKLDLKQAIQQTVSKDESVPPPGNGPLLRWSVANDASVYGYIIYRADAEAGPSLRVNKEIIRTVGEGGPSTASYQWRDNSATSGKTYWYSIGMVKGSGEKVPLSSAQKVVAK